MRTSRLGLVIALSSAWVMAPVSSESQQPRPTIRFVIPQIEQTRSAQATMAARPSPTPDMSPYWWNQPEMIESLGLSEEQRKEMDEAMRETQRLMTESIRKQNAARDRFEEAVRKRNWSEAREAARLWEEGIAQQWGVVNRSKIDILEKLTVEQHHKLVHEHEYLLQRPWTLGQRIQIRLGTPSPAAGTPSAAGPTPGP